MRTTVPGISVIIPVYNRETLVVEAIESVLRQTVVAEGADAAADSSLPLLEVIVVDDGSTDGTREAVRALEAAGADTAARPPEAPPALPVRLRELAHSGMPGLVRNRGVEWAQGTVVAFLDADDLWRPEKLARQRELHTRYGFELTHTRERWERWEGAERGVRVVSQRGQRHRRRGFVFDESLEKCILGPSTLMIARSTYERTGGFREDIEIAEDYEYFLRLTDHIPVGYVDEELTVKRAGSGDQLSERYGQIEVFRLEALRNLVDGRYWRERPELERAARVELARKCAIYGRGAWKRGRAMDAARYEALAREYLSEFS